MGCAFRSRITLGEAKRAVDAAEAEAVKNGWKLVFLITDARNTPIDLRRMDGVPTRNYEIAVAKTHTSLTRATTPGQVHRATQEEYLTDPNVRAAAWLLAPIVAAAQAGRQPAVVPLVAATSCSGCRIAVREIGLISDDVFDTDLEVPRVMRHAPNGFVVGGRRGEFGLFDERLRYVRSIGREGSGPGEFRMPAGVLP